MALVHDMAECIVGDIVPSDPISKEEKHRQERVGRPKNLCEIAVIISVPATSMSQISWI